MRLRFLIVLCLISLTAVVAVAQDPKKALNEEMWEAARKGDVAAVTAALDKGADVNAKFRYGTTALFKAAERGHAPVVKLLIERGADVTVKDTYYGATAMTWALQGDHIDAVRELLVKDTENVSEVLMTGAREGKAPLVEIALAKGSLKPETLTQAYAAVMDDKEKVAIAELLKKAGAAPPMQVDAAILQTYTGRFKPDTGNEFAITVKDGRLFGSPTGQPPIALMATDTTTFKPVAFDGIVITFVVENGKATSFTLKQGPTTTVFKRVEETKQP